MVREICVAVVLGWSALGMAAATALGTDIGTAFAYQGSLENGSGPVTDTCDFRFGLWDAAAGGNQVGTSPQTVVGITVENGVFTTLIDFGAGAIDGTARWLAVEVKCTPDVAFVPLDSQRVALTPAPHALALPGLYTQQNATSPNIVGGHSVNSVTSGVVGATISGGGTSGINENNRVTDDFGTIGGGTRNQAGDAAGDFLSAGYATVSGGILNIAGGNCSAVGGGIENTASGNYSTISGGNASRASSPYSTVGGGIAHIASGDFSTINGGFGNTASGLYSTVGGGRSNQAGGSYGFAAGFNAKIRTANQSGDSDGDEGTFVWADSTDSPFTSTGPDQFLIRASGGVGIGTNSPQANLHVAGSGSLAKVLLTPATANSNTEVRLTENSVGTGGAIMRYDGTANEWQLLGYVDPVELGPHLTVRRDSPSRVGIGRTAPSHPLHVGTDSTNGNGAHCTIGGVWTNGSDRNSKRNFEDIDQQEILRKVAELPITRWQYKGEPENVRHIGPVAQDFYASFATGEDEKYIGTIDADGVALAAIQGLNQVVQEKDCEMGEMELEISNFKSEISNLQSEISDLRAMVKALADQNGGAK